MRTDVIPHEEIRPLLRRWRRSLAPTHEEQVRLARDLWAAFVQSIRDAAGPPLGSVVNATTEPPTFLCAFPGGLAEVVVRYRREGWFTTVREVIVINLNFSPGLPEPAR